MLEATGRWGWRRDIAYVIGEHWDFEVLCGLKPRLPAWALTTSHESWHAARGGRTPPDRGERSPRRATRSNRWLRH